MYVDPGGTWAVPSPNGLGWTLGFAAIDWRERANAFFGWMLVVAWMFVGG